METLTIPGTVPAPSTITQPELIPAPDADIIHHIFDDVFADIGLGKRVIQAYKAGGKEAALALLPEVVATGKKDFDDIKTFIPVVKAGLKSSEFWINFAVIGVISGLAAVGKPLPINETVIISSLAMVYTLVRSILKAKTAVPVATVVK